MVFLQGTSLIGGLAGIYEESEIDETSKKNHAVQTLVDTVTLHPNEVTVVALGPLTNIALATLMNPSFVACIDKLVFMGCAVSTGGNTTSAAEFNVGSDPEAAQIILQNFPAAKLLIVPWDLCLQHGLSWSVYDQLTSSGTSAGKFTKDICKHYEEHCREEQQSSANDQGMFVPCDAYAMAILLHDDYVVDSRVQFGYIELRNGSQRGASIIVDSTANPLKANATVVNRIDQSIFEKLLLEL